MEASVADSITDTAATAAQAVMQRVVALEQRATAAEARLTKLETPPTSRWYAASSYINTKVASAPTLDPNSASMVSMLMGTSAATIGLYTNMADWTTTVYHANNATPKTRILLDVYDPSN